jgi:hypothetical protein
VSHRTPARATATALALLALMGAAGEAADAKPAKVRGERIVNGAGDEMRVRGVAWGTGMFVPSAPGAALPSPSLGTARRDFRRIQRLGGNVVRIEVSSAADTPEHLAALRSLQRLAKRHVLTLVLANVPLDDGDQSAWLGRLAEAIGPRDNVWYLPEVDAGCGALQDGTACGDVEAWVWSHGQAVRALRGAGVRTPIVIGLPGQGEDASRAAIRALGDRNLIIGLHPRLGPGDGFAKADGEALERATRVAKGRPVIFDDVARVERRVSGRSTTTSTLPLARVTGLMDWITAWTVLDGGDGAIVDGWHGAGADALERGRRLTPWGQAVATGYFAVGYRAQSGRDVAAGHPGALEPGDRGPAVRRLQRSLQRLGYLGAGAVTGRYTTATWHAVVAFQGYSRADRDGVAGPRTIARLQRVDRPRARHRNEGPHVEVDLTRQILLVVDGKGDVRRVVHISSGRTGNTPTGRFTAIRKEQMSWSVPFESWMPWATYFVGGFAMHEYADVPAYPASAGCVRLPAHEARMIYGVADMGMPIILYRS